MGPTRAQFIALMAHCASLKYGRAQGYDVTLMEGDKVIAQIDADGNFLSEDCLNAIGITEAAQLYASRRARHETP